MTRKEYDLIFQAFKSYRPFMTDAEEVLSEKILDDLFYPHFDKLSTDDDFEDDCFDEIVKMQRKHLLMSQKSNHLILGVNYEKRTKH